MLAKKHPKNLQKAKNTVSLGIKALKWDPFGSSYMTISNEQMQKSSDIVGAVREAVGNNVDLLIECHGRFNPTTALNISRELEQYHPMFMEEPCVPDNLDSTAYVRMRSKVPIAAGERGYGIYAFEDMLEKKCVDYLQPDIFHAGGLMTGKKSCRNGGGKAYSGIISQSVRSCIKCGNIAACSNCTLIFLHTRNYAY
ncbi:MAG: hypothetical protein L6V93_02005 [Clostridiales bacterium]|nr:MAG: hypothetical protein L6V93_02005 [Clostridiales bacterium]